MKCPYCFTSINLNTKKTVFRDELCIFDDDYEDTGYALKYGFCPECNRPIVLLAEGKYCNAMSGDYIAEEGENIILYPKFPSVTQLSNFIPQKYVALYQEAEQVNNISPRASATLSRYLLQMILHEELNIKKRNLEEEITELESQSHIPSTLVTFLQGMRRVANFAAHPKKSTNSAEIVEIEEGESAVMLELINELFDFVFVKPAKETEFVKKIEAKYGIKSEA